MRKMARNWARKLAAGLSGQRCITYSVAASTVSWRLLLPRRAQSSGAADLWDRR